MNMTAKNAQRAATAENDPRWASVVARDPGADGTFYYSVKTTGVYCRPSCAARLARPENIRFHTTCADAEQAGFRPCKRCKPDQPSLAWIPTRVYGPNIWVGFVWMFQGGNAPGGR